MHKWLQLPATPTDDPLASVYPSNHYKKSHVYAVTRINPIYVDDELHQHHGTWNRNDSSGYDSQPHSDHSSSLDKNSPPGTKCLRSPPPSPTGKLSGGQLGAVAASWLSPIEEGVVDVRLFVPRPVWPGHGDGDPAHCTYTDRGRIPRAKCCRSYDRCRCLSNGIGGGNGIGTGGNISSNSSSSSSNNSSGSGSSVDSRGDNGLRAAAVCSYSGYSSAYGGSGSGTVSTSTTTSGGGGGATCSCSDDANQPSSGIGSVSSSNKQSPLTLQPPRFGIGTAGNFNNKALINCTWNPAVDLRLNQKTDNLHNDCDAMLRGLQFTLDAQQAEKLMQKIKVGKKHRCWCRLVTTFIGLIMFLVSVVTVTLIITKGKRMFGSI